jgi:hypothetical protein
MSLFDWDDRLCKKGPRPPDYRVSDAGRRTWQIQGNDRLLVNPDHVHRDSPMATA